MKKNEPLTEEQMVLLDEMTVANIKKYLGYVKPPCVYDRDESELGISWQVDEVRFDLILEMGKFPGLKMWLKYWVVYEELEDPFREITFLIYYSLVEHRFAKSRGSYGLEKLKRYSGSSRVLAEIEEDGEERRETAERLGLL